MFTRYALKLSHSLLMTVCVLASIARSVSAQEHDEVESAHRWGVAGFIGATRVHGENEFTLGIEGGYSINPEWNVGAVVERSDRRRDTTLVLAGVGWHPFGPALRLQLGAGTKDPSGKRELVYRLGFGYEFELENSWVLKPYVAFDFIENEENEQVFGVYIGRGF